MRQENSTNAPFWSHSLATERPYYINSTAISGNGEMVIAGTFYHQYNNSASCAASDINSPLEHGNFGTYAFTREGQGQVLWQDVFEGYEGVYWVAISNDGTTAASGGWFSDSPSHLGFVRAYNAGNGQSLLSGFYPPARVNALALSANGQTLVAAADQVYLFQMADGEFPSTPATFPLQGDNNNAQMVCVAADGSCFVAIDNQGSAYLIENDGGQIGASYQWPPQPLISLHALAMAANAPYFVLGGHSTDGIPTIWLFSIQSFSQSTPMPIAQLALEPTAEGSIRSIAISGDGSFISVIVNQQKTGMVYAVKYDGQELYRVWRQPTQGNPNSTSVDDNATCVTAADGYPDGNPGHFYLFDGATGALQWMYPTSNMSWPMFVSADGSGIAAGSDNGTVYYFTTGD
ncbi:MAG TPA: hypothetical protein PLD20_33380 [Blastocatellia bacterium]|nr:hypothetical protein [Blastocatellia bacterium]HMV82419.1 hypothetical protein [Blastocatellia bacterium]HMX27820.1 hypothetical protein [Blastocatellia bacterium]HMY73702.1 hypothetical protein [Blastocatellia bacterium]HMZ22865.1 hypothetical protein [Blastocatellia bacterium]